ncbi:MAG: deoxyribodipyrimidine photo-lyase [Ancalomicrobiaceae bacterium]|nr:deoxyribodipyrimidine photo-lyase [Ancalomicrobiaceae bacterium]
MSSAPSPILVWLRRDLRLDDSAALARALASGHPVLPVFVFDTDILNLLPRADRRVEFIHATVAALKADLNAFGGDLLVRHGSALDEIPRLAAELGASEVFANRDYEPSAIARDRHVENRLAAIGVGFRTFKDQVVFERDEITTAAGGMYSVFTPYSRAWRRALTAEALKPHLTRPLFAALAERPPKPMPSLTELGFAPTDLATLGIAPGPAGAEALFGDFLGRIDAYGETRDFPAVKGVSYLSVHLRFGTISIRRLMTHALGRRSEGAEKWLAELIWREFYSQILWHRPDVVAHAFKPEYDDLDFTNDETLFRAWVEGRTGYPIVDAAMRQLNTTGYMHNRLRMITASFLVKDLLVDWRWGEKLFAERLIDFDLASNNGGWQWAASTGCDAQPYFRIFNPVAQSQKFDPDGGFIHRFVPELAGLAAPAIHAPWLARPLELAAAGVRLGETYSHPIVDHAIQRDRALALYKRA